MMQVPHVLLLLCLLATGNSINRPVVKIVLNQKGYAQFIQYDVEIPPMREFTLCTWVRFGDLAGDQTIFSYVGSGSTRIIRVWLEGGEGGRLQKLRVALDSRASSSTTVQFTPGVWHHLCLSYQSDHGAWALYIDSRLVFCQASHKLLGYIIPGGGSLIIGYGTSEKGTPNGLEGQIFGASMILYSTIERNYTLKVDPQYEQKPFRKNYLKDKNNQDNRYIILGDLQSDEIRSNLQETTLPNKYNKSRNFIHFTTPHSYVDHDVGIEIAPGSQKQPTSSTEKEILDIEETANFESNENNNRVSFWSLVNKSEKPKMKNHTKMELTESGTRDLAMVFEYETPPSVTAIESDYSNKGLQMQGNSFWAKNNNKIPNSYVKDTISEMETPPPPEEKLQVYGQWTNSKFVGNVLKYLKSINFNSNRQSNKVPSTIPLVRLSDSFPYASEFEYAKIRPQIKFNRKKISSKHHILSKRDTNQPQINLQVVETDLRSEILKSHSETQPKHVEVTNRGEAKHNADNRHYRHAESYTDSLKSLGSLQITPNLSNGQPFSVTSSRKKQILLTNLERHRGSKIMTILPFLKSEEYFVNNKNNGTKEIETDPMYSKSFANANKWHNVKSYSNDYTPRRIDLEADGKNPIDVKIAEANKKHPSIKYKYNHDDHKLVNAKTDVSIERGRALAEEVSNQANEQNSLYSLFKYNHGYLPGHERKKKSRDKINNFPKSSSNTKKKDDFNKNVKLGNALNERDIIGRDENDSKKSFIGGNDEIPDINKYRSQGENTVETVPPSLGPKVCKNVELYDRVMYVQPDGSIDMSHIFSPVREKNIGIEFIIQNYKRCSMQDSILQKNPYLLIDWSKTPVKLFGGAYPRQTKDLCGFF